MRENAEGIRIRTTRDRGFMLSQLVRYLVTFGMLRKYMSVCMNGLIEKTVEKGQRMRKGQSTVRALTRPHRSTTSSTCASSHSHAP